MNKDGFVSMAVIYTFIIVFVLIILSLLSLYAFRNKVINNLVEDVKTNLNERYGEWKKDLYL